MLRNLGRIIRGFSTCRTTAAFLLDYVEGRLSEKTARKFEEHIAMCPNCERYLEQYRTTIKMLKNLPAPDPPDELADMTRAFIEESLDLDKS